MESLHRVKRMEHIPMRWHQVVPICYYLQRVLLHVHIEGHLHRPTRSRGQRFGV